MGGCMLSKLRSALASAFAFLTNAHNLPGGDILQKVDEGVAHAEAIVETLDKDLKAALARIDALEAIVKPASSPSST